MKKKIPQALPFVAILIKLEPFVYTSLFTSLQVTSLEVLIFPST